jgi:hypothetical protein
MSVAACAADDAALSSARLVGLPYTCLEVTPPDGISKMKAIIVIDESITFLNYQLFLDYRLP